MKQKLLVKVESRECPIAKSINMVGDKWILLLLRECFFGASRFESFQENLGISRSVLSAKLNRMIELGLLIKVKYRKENQRERDEYLLEEKGRSLIKMLIALYEWGSKYRSGSERLPYHLNDRRSRTDISLKISNGSGGEVDPSDIRLKF